MLEIFSRLSLVPARFNHKALVRCPLMIPFPRQLIGSTEAPYVAIHLRMGGFDGEWKPIVRFDQFKVSYAPACQ